MEDYFKTQPNHVGIIVDGNRRWAKNNGVANKLGHKYGFKRLETIIDHAITRKVRYLSLFVFSTENFQREAAEVDYLMKLFANNFKDHAMRMNKKKVRVIFSGDRQKLPINVRKSIEYIENLTFNNSEAIINFCLNYGGRSEIVFACKSICADVISQRINSEDIDEETFEKYLYNSLPPIDLMIRTSGELRISNFMLWHLAYSELYFIEKYFPDFDERDLDNAIREYGNRERRFGIK